MIKNKIFQLDHTFIIKYSGTLWGNQKKEYLKVPQNIQSPLLFFFLVLFDLANELIVSLAAHTSATGICKFVL